MSKTSHNLFELFQNRVGRENAPDKAPMMPETSATQSTEQMFLLKRFW